MVGKEWGPKEPLGSEAPAAGRGRLMARAWEPASPPTFWQVSEINVHKIKLKSQVKKDRTTGGPADNLSDYAVWPDTGSPGNEEDTVHIPPHR